MDSSRGKRVSNLPPNPSQWQPERNGLAFRRRFEVPVADPLRPFEVGRRFDDVKLLRRRDLEGWVSPEALNEAYGASRHRWSAVTVPLNGAGFVIIVNDTHAVTRQNATLMEEFFHIILGHKPTRLMPCALTGLIRREYDRDTEQAAYWSAAAALVPYGALRAMVHGGRETAVIAQHFEVSDALVAFRLKVTKLWKRRRC